MKILFDTNVILDSLFTRTPWNRDASLIWKRCEMGADTGFIPASVLTDIYYIARQQKDRESALKSVELCYNSFELCSVDTNIVGSALQLPHKDFEDNILIACAKSYALDAIITRNKKDFQHSPVDVYSPSEWLDLHTPNSSNDH